MGVTGLWKLIDPCGKPVPVETLESKVLAVDISIWLHQVVKGFQDSKGSALPNAHLLGLFHRLCKLLYYRVKPVFVFDGCVPQLKRDTIARRQLQRSKLNTEADRIQALLFESLAKEKVVQQALGTSAAELLLKSPRKKNIRVSRADDTIDDIFKLPELPAASTASKADADNESDLNDSYADFSSDYATTSTTDDSSFDESNSRHYYNANIQAIDVRSKHFKELPADVRHDILVDIKETRKQSSWGRLHELPSKSYDFSTFQMKRLLKRRAVQESIEEAEQEMGGRSLTYNELKNLFTEEGIVEPTAMDVGSKQISSNEHTRFLLVRDLKKKLATLNEDIKKEESIDSKIEEQTIYDGKPCCSQETKITVEDSETIKNNALDNKYASDLELAIALSLGESNVYSAKDYEYDSDENIKLNKDQRKQLKNAATGPARAFMIEYAGMNEEEVIGIMEKTQNDIELSLSKVFTNDESCVLKDTEDKMRLHVTTEDTDDDIRLHVAIEDSEEDIRLHVSTDSETETEIETIKTQVSSTQQKEQNNEINLTNISDTDSDLEEVPENVENSRINKTIEKNVSSKKCLQVVVDLTKSLVPQDDLFADIFRDGNSIDINSESKSSIKKSEHNLQKELLNSNEDVNSVLEELKKQANEIKSISLDDIKIDTSIIELSDEDISYGDKFMKHEVVEVFDENGKGALKSPNSKTPTKNKPISEYFETNYFIKRTPDKPKDDENVPTVKSPFFVNKTPKSGRKRSSVSNSGSPSPEKKISKVSKSLFSNYENTVDENEEKRKSKVTAEDVLNEAAIVLKEQKTTDELKELASDIAKEKTDLENERNRQDRMGMSINQRMNSECQELLRLFGIPYIVAPMEAEAQCAFLNTIELTNGTITDDSDIWLFGGRTVYKNFFAQNKHVLEFRANEIEKSFNCDRIKLIQLACLVGSDYTTGIHGIGAVTAMEILASFSPKNDQSSASENLTAKSASLATLSRFRNWWAASKSSTMPPCNSTRLTLLKKLKNIELHDGFPNIDVINAYLDPKIDENKDTFSWGCPDVESIREFAKKKLGWTTSKTDDILMPVMKKLNEKKSQATIKNYFTVKSAISLGQMKVSKRVQNAIDKMSGKVEDATPEKPKRQQRTRAKRKNDSKTTTEDSEESRQNQHTDISLEASPSDGLKAYVDSQQMGKRKIILPETKEIIPQRVKDIEQLRKNKELAIKVLKRTSKTKKQS